MGGRRIAAAAVKATTDVPYFKSLDRFVRYRQAVVENQLRRLQRHGFDIHGGKSAKDARTPWLQPDFFLSQISRKPYRLHIDKH